MENRIFVIGIDGATFKIIDHLVEQGKLANIDRLRRQGASGVLTSTIPTVSPVAWTSFMTGMNPENHQIYDFTGKDPKNHGFRFHNASHRQAPPVWMKLSEHGKNCLVIGVTMTYPPDPVNGYMISGLGAPIDRAQPSHTYPKELADEIDRNIGKYRITPEVNFRKLSRSAKERDKYVHGIADQIEHRIDLFQYLWKKDRFDFSMLFFLDTDGASHYLWRYMDKDHAHHIENRHADAIFQIYEHIDAAIGKLLTIVDDDSVDIIILSDHGFGPLNRVVFMNNLLQEMGYLKFKQGSLLEKTLSKFKPGPKAGPKIIWPETQAYFNGTFGNIYINLKGREPGGVVDPEQYEDLRDRLIADLQQVKDPETGGDVIDDIVRPQIPSDQLCTSIAPDLIATFKRGYSVIGEEIALHNIKDQGKIIDDANNWSGNHELDGILIAHGKSFKRGHHIEGARIIDVAPTILHLQGLPIPRSMDGKLLTDILLSDGARAGEVRYEAAERGSAAPPAEDRAFSDAENEQLVRRLKDLGYLE